MKRIFLLVLAFMAIQLNAQIYQPALLYGKNENRTHVQIDLGIPNDTLAVPSIKQGYPHIAAKGLSLYTWDTTLKKWQLYAPAAANTDSLFGVQDNIATGNRSFDLNTNDFAFLNGGEIGFYSDDKPITLATSAGAGNSQLILDNNYATISSAVGINNSAIELRSDSILISQGTFGVINLPYLRTAPSTTDMKAMLRGFGGGLYEISLDSIRSTGQRFGKEDIRDAANRYFSGANVATFTLDSLSEFNSNVTGVTGSQTHTSAIAQRFDTGIMLTHLSDYSGVYARIGQLATDASTGNSQMLTSNNIDTSSVVSTQLNLIKFDQSNGVYEIDDLPMAANMTGKHVMVWDSTNNRWLRIIKDSIGTSATPGLEDVIIADNVITGNQTVSHGLNQFSFQSDGITGNVTLQLVHDDANTNIYKDLLNIRRTTSGTPAAGLGGAIAFLTENLSTVTESGRIVNKWSDVTHATRTSEYDFIGLNSSATETFANIQKGGIVRVNNLADTLATKAYARSVGGTPIIDSAWLLTGNSPAAYGKYFGTNNDFDLRIFTNGTERMRFDSAFNRVGINSLPSASEVVLKVKSNGTDNTYAAQFLSADDARYFNFGYISGIAEFSMGDGTTSFTFRSNGDFNLGPTTNHRVIGYAGQEWLGIGFYGGVVINEVGADSDFRVEGDTKDNLFLVDAGKDEVYVGDATDLGDFRLQVIGKSGVIISTNGTNYMNITAPDVNASYFTSNTNAIVFSNSAGTYLRTNNGLKVAIGGGTAPDSTLTVLNGGGRFEADVTVPDEVYDATAWNGSLEVPTKNAIRDKIESLSAGGLTIGTTTIANSATRRVLYDSAGILSNNNLFQYNADGELLINISDQGTYDLQVGSTIKLGTDVNTTITGTAGGLYLAGDASTYIYSGNFQRVAASSTDIVFNDIAANYDLRVEGQTKDYGLFFDASKDEFYVGFTGVPTDNGVYSAQISGGLFVQGASGNQALVLQPTTQYDEFMHWKDHTGVSRVKFYIDGNNSPALFGPPTWSFSDGSNMYFQVRGNDFSGTESSVLVRTVVAGKPGIKIELPASPTADAFQVFNSTPTKIAWIDSTGSFTGGYIMPRSNNFYTIGSSAGNKYNDIFSFNVSASAWYMTDFAGASVRFTRPADGQLLLRNEAATSFDMVMLGGSTSSFPALQKSGTDLRARLADNSANTNIIVLGEAYNATNWDGDDGAATKNDVRDKIESLPVPYTNLTSFVDQTAWRVFYSNGSGDVTELALGGSGTYLQSNGASSAPTWVTPAGAGTVTNTGGSLTANAVVLGAGGADTKVSTGITTNGGSELNLGVNATTIGKVKMFGNTSGDATIQPTAVAGTATVQTLPSVTGTLVNRVSTGSGVSANNTDGALEFSLGAIVPTTINGNTWTTGTGTLTLGAGKTFTASNTMTFSGTDAAIIAVNTGGVVGTNTISPAQITGDQDNWNPAGLDDATKVRLSGDATIRAITSITAPTQIYKPQQKILTNTGTFPVYFPSEHPDGTAANRFINTEDFILNAGKSCIIDYDVTSSRWRIIGRDNEIQNNTVSYMWSAGSVTSGDHGAMTFLTIGTGTNTATAATTTLPASMLYSTAASATAGWLSYFSKTVATYSAFGTGHNWTEAVVSIPTLSTGTETFFSYLQLTATPATTTAEINNSIGIRYNEAVNGGRWQLYTQDNAGGESVADLGITVATATLYKLRIEIDKAKTEARAYINDVYAGRVTGNMPNSVVMGSRTLLVKTVGTTARTMAVHSQSAGAIHTY